MQWSFKIIQTGQLSVVLLHTVIYFNIIIIFLQWFLMTVDGPNDQISTAMFLVTSQRWSSANALITALMYLFTVQTQTQIISGEHVKKVNTRHKFLRVFKCDEFQTPVQTLTTFGQMKKNNKNKKSIKKFLSTCTANLNLLVYQSAQKLSHVIYFIYYDSRTPETRTLKGNEKSSSWRGIRFIGVNFSEILIKEKEI